ncbi:methyltransferase domain-containing protein [Archangium sp.]|uniref:methyltransferase domain-containing protein n=1 Tax=Archangium sp. TaxID=1872627 RepID=UPI0038998DDB
MGESSNLAQDFRNIDRSAASTKAVRFLDTVNTIQQVQEMQRLSHRLLGACEGARVLDVGCGLGDVARELGAMVGKSGQVTGIDLSENMVSEARRRTEGTGLNIDYRQGDVHRLEFPSNTFDGSRASRVFIYLEDPLQALSEMLRVTRPGGSVVFFEVELDSWVLDGPNPSMVRRLIHYWADQLKNPWICRRIPGLFRSLGVSELSINPVVGTWVFSMLETFGVYPVLEKAILEGVATRGEVDEWLHFMKEADRTGSFYGSMSGMVIRGIKPVS